jgi:uncharacterized membrane protein YbhN (UPF0104 family)
MRIGLAKLAPLIPVVMLPLGVWLGYRVLRGHELSEVVASVALIPAHRLGLAVACAMASYVCLTGFDFLAVRNLGRSLPYPTIAVASFVSLSIGHNIGVAVLSSGMLRYHFYSSAGLGAGDVVKVILFCGVTVGLGLISLGGLALVMRPELGAAMTGLAPGTARVAGGLGLLLVGSYLGLAWRVRHPLRVWGLEIQLPRARIALAQILLGTANFAFVAATLHQLLQSGPGYSEVVMAYVLGNAAALVSHVPGGLGVLEYVISRLILGESAVSALIAFRIVYYLVPLALGSMVLVATEWARRRTG